MNSALAPPEGAMFRVRVLAKSKRTNYDHRAGL